MNCLHTLLDSLNYFQNVLKDFKLNSPNNIRLYERTAA